METASLGLVDVVTSGLTGVVRDCAISYSRQVITIKEYNWFYES